MKTNADRINYSQCWEDPRTLLAALQIKPEDSVLSITSGGDNTLALCLAGARSTVSVDLNLSQNYLLELKLTAAQTLTYDELLEFIGVRASSRRAALMTRLAPKLSPACTAWWQSHEKEILRGVIHCGRFERFLAGFRQFLLPLIHNRSTILAFLHSPSLPAQQQFYNERWNSLRWRLYFRLTSSRIILKHFARQRGMFSQTRGGSAGSYMDRLKQNFTSVPLADNFFMHYALTGEYIDVLPPYLERPNHPHLAGVAPVVVTANIIEYLKSQPADSFSKFNLSDIFEALTPEQNDELWKQLVRTAKNGARVAYWNNLVPRSYPPELAASIINEERLASDLHSKDRVFFYGSFNLHTIKK